MTSPPATDRTNFQEWLLSENEPVAASSARSGPRRRLRSPRAVPAPNLGEVEALVHKSLTQRPAVAPGRIFLIDLASLKAALGDRWVTLCEVVESGSRAAFERHLAPGDVYCKHGDDGFLVVFDDRSIATAASICQRIADDLRAMPIGRSGGAEVIVSTVVGHRDSRLLLEEVAPPQGAAPPAAAQTSVRAGSSVDPGWSRIRWRGGAEAMVESRLRATAAGDTEDEPRWEPLLIERLNRPVLLEPAIAMELDAANGPTYLFQPVWDANNKLLSTYHCLTSDEAASEPTYMATRAGRTDIDGDAVGASDLNKLLNAVDMLNELVSNNFQLFITAGVHAETMGTLRLRTQYLHVLRRIPERLQKLLILQIYGLPAGIATGRIVACVTALRPNCGAIFVETGLNPADVGKYAGIGVHAVGVDLRSVAPSEQRLFGDLARFAAEADRHRLWTFLTGVTTSSQVVGATAAGIRYLSGRRVGPASQVPMHIRKFNLEDFYSGLVGDGA